MRKGSLESFTEPREYASLLRSNIRHVDEMTSSPSFLSLSLALGSYTGIDDRVMRTIAARMLLTANESHEQAFAYRPFAVWLHHFVWLVRAMIRSPRPQPLGAGAELLLGEWQDGASKRYDLLSHRASAAGISNRVVNLNATDSCGLVPALRSLPQAIKTMRKLSQIRRVLGLNAAWVAASVIREHLIGLRWRQTYQARVLLTACDNGEFYVRGHAARLSLVLVQNGCRTGSDACFIVADHYMALEPLGYPGCLLSETGSFRGHQAGSLALANHWASRPSREPVPQIDLLWVSSFPGTDQWAQFEVSHGHALPLSYLTNSFRAFIDFAKRADVRATFAPRWPGECDALRQRGLDLSGVRILDTSATSTYDAIERAEIVLSSFSTVVFEAMMIEKTAGFIFLTDDPEVIPFARREHLLFDGGDEDEFAAFVERLPSSQPKGASFVVHPDATPQIIIDVVATDLMERTRAIP